MKIKFLSLMVAVIMTLTLCTGIASAFPLFPGIGTLPGTQLEDDDLDFHIDLNPNGIIDIGDVLIAPIELTKIIDPLPPLNPTYNLNQAVDELVALATVQVIPNLPTDPAGRIRFGQFGGTPMVQLFQGGTNLDVTADPTLGAAIVAATDGTPLWAFSIDGDLDTEWFFDPAPGFGGVANNPAFVKTQLSTTKLGTVNYALNQVSGPDIFNPLTLNPSGFTCGPFGCLGDDLVDFAGSADILGGFGLTNGAFARSDADASLNPIPEPSTLALLGVGLLAAGLAGRRRS
jgi:hypothetical protein